MLIPAVQRLTERFPKIIVLVGEERVTAIFGEGNGAGLHGAEHGNNKGLLGLKQQRLRFS